MDNKHGQWGHGASVIVSAISPSEPMYLIYYNDMITQGHVVAFIRHAAYIRCVYVHVSISIPMGSL